MISLLSFKIILYHVTTENFFRILNIVCVTSPLERAKKREYTGRVRNISKILEEINNLKIKAAEYKVCRRRKPRGH